MIKSSLHLLLYIVILFMTLTHGQELTTDQTQEMPSYKVEQVKSAPLTSLGGGPHWDVERQSLYFNDIYGGQESKYSIHRYDFAEDKTYNALVEGEPVIGFIIPVFGKNNEFIVGTGPRVSLINWDGKSPVAKKIRVIAEVDQDKKGTRFNDAKADPRGRLFAGTMRLEELGDIFEAREGTFYRYTNSSGFIPIKRSIGVSNGLAWNEKAKKFYYIDSCDLDVKEYDYDVATGNISNERVVIALDNKEKRTNSFVPDGMTIDNQGNLYVATFGGSKVLKINPTTKKIELEINIPAEQVTSAAFGGPNLDILYVTTAGKEFSSPQPSPAGGLFKVTGLGVKGTPMFSAVV